MNRYTYFTPIPSLWNALHAGNYLNCTESIIVKENYSQCTDIQDLNITLTRIFNIISRSNTLGHAPCITEHYLLCVDTQ